MPTSTDTVAAKSNVPQQHFVQQEVIHPDVEKVEIASTRSQVRRAVAVDAVILVEFFGLL